MFDYAMLKLKYKLPLVLNMNFEANENWCSIWLFLLFLQLKHDVLAWILEKVCFF